MRKIFLCLALILCAFVLPSFADDEKYIVVDVESSGPSRLEAINNGLLDAIRTAAGSFIDAKSELNNDELNEKIISYSRGSVAKYEVLAADDTRASEELYNVKVRVWVERDLIRDGVKVATNRTATVSFRPEDLQPEKSNLDAKELETHDAIAKTENEKKQNGVELLSAMLERYNPEDFISFHVVGKVTPVKNKTDMVQVLVEVSFNDKLYNEAFIPDLKQVLDVIAAKKKDITLTKQRDVLRKIKDKKGAPLANNSVVLTGADLGKDFSLAVYDKPDRFGCRLYAFSKDDAEKILNNKTGILAQFRARIAQIKGFEIELLDENDELVSSEESKIILPFLLTDSTLRDNIWAFHQSLMSFQGAWQYVPLYVENSTVTIPLQFELPAEFQEITRSIKANLITDEDFSDAWLKTRAACHDTALNIFTKGTSETRSLFDEAAECEYPLALYALQSIEANEIYKDAQNLLLDEVIDRLEPGVEAGNHAAMYYSFKRLEDDVENFENQKKCVPFLTLAAAVDPDAMIRMGEVQEQGFYGVKADPKKAQEYYNEGTRILTLLANEGMPSATVRLGRVYLEGLGTKQDTRRAERLYDVATKAGYEDPEFWTWKYYGVTMRQVAISEKMAEFLRNYFNMKDQRTCIYLVREKLYGYEENYMRRLTLINVPVSYVAFTLQQKPKGPRDFQTLQPKGDSFEFVRKFLELKADAK